MIKVYSQRLMPPFSGQVQIAESERARALTMDGEIWEIHFRKGTREAGQASQYSYTRAANIRHSELGDYRRDKLAPDAGVDERILELTEFLADTSLPFPAADRYEYWLLDASDKTPLALIFTCTESADMETFPARAEWTALPAAVLPIEATPDEIERCDSPVNYRMERLVAERAGTNPEARWFTRGAHDEYDFPALMLREDWDEAAQDGLCQRYIQRLSTRLLTLHGLSQQDRLRLEQAAKAHVFEVERFFRMYPAVADKALMSAIRVEARLRGASEEQESGLQDRRDGVLYQ